MASRYSPIRAQSFSSATLCARSVKRYACLLKRQHYAWSDNTHRARACSSTPTLMIAEARITRLCWVDNLGCSCCCRAQELHEIGGGGQAADRHAASCVVVAQNVAFRNHRLCCRPSSQRTTGHVQGCLLPHSLVRCCRTKRRLSRPLALFAT